MTEGETHRSTAVTRGLSRKGETMKYCVLLVAALFAAEVSAAPSVATVPSRQNLTAVEYASGGRQTGCGLRVTGETDQNLALNVLITVFMKEPGVTFGVVKVVARKMDVKDGVPVPQDGLATSSTIGQIRKAWIKPDSGGQPLVYRNGRSSHNDAYMVTTEFSGTVDLMLAISQEKFRVGVNRRDTGPDEIFQFDQRLGRQEAGKLSLCMNNLRAAIEESKHDKAF